MKRILNTVLVAALALSGTSLFAQDRPAQRQRNQQKRIVGGVANDELTKREVKRLETKEKALHQEIVRDRKDGGGLSKKERVKIEAKQDALSRDIAKQKHDAQKQK
jgi:cell division protein FtsB